ncbi:hypothetical protein N8501_01435 [Synechococcus sp. AH-601-N10]|nr:hypothetical protein [Synechococcus sp. AH-601-N10]
MDILFIHGNFPGQFKYLANAFAESGQNRVKYLTGVNKERTSSLKNIGILEYQIHRSVGKDVHQYIRTSEEAVLNGQAVIRAIDQAIMTGFEPRLIIYHGGMGLGLFLKTILPNTITIGYFEWHFSPSDCKVLLNKSDVNTYFSAEMRNLPIYHELISCDAGVVPTEWQKSRFPEIFHDKLNIIFDGIDQSFFKPYKTDLQKTVTLHSSDHLKQQTIIQKGDLVLSYATRGMEPLRGFPEFMNALPKAFSTFDNLKVVIAGADRCAYSYAAENESGSWKDYMLSKLRSKLKLENISFTGLLTYVDYRKLLWRSNLHCYFTRPYVTSWSLFEAAACGASMLVSRGKATDNILMPSSVWWTDLNSQEDVNIQIINGLKSRANGTYKQAVINEGFSLTESLKKWERLINKQLNKNK